MKLTSFTNSMLATVLVFVSSALSGAQRVEYVEDLYCIQASQEWVDKVDQVAKKVGFTSNYEVATPKKPALQINLWNRFIASGINPGTKNWFILINPEWATTLSEPQQEFLIARCLMFGVHGMTNAWSFKLILSFFFLMRLLIIFALFRLLSATFLAKKSWVIRIAIAMLVNTVIAFTVVNKIEQKIQTYFGQRHDLMVTEAAIAKTGDREAAIAALEAFDNSIKCEIEKGETALIPYKELFSTLVQNVKRQ